MIHRPAQYLLRFDDLCPTMSRARWQPFFTMIEQYGIRPILAVVPDNRDPELELDEPDPEFWNRMCALEASGATIALHGYRHLCQSRGRSLVPFHRTSEFAGVPLETQRLWIRAGLAILRGHGLHPRIWVAPRHGFDVVTLRVLREEGIELLSDGLARLPFIRYSLTWLPQQLWAPEQKAAGLWTILMHVNTAPQSLIRDLEAFLRLYSAQFTSVDRAVAALGPAELRLKERLFEEMALLRLKQWQIRKRLLDRQ
jgi:predicted deacetylase